MVLNPNIFKVYYLFLFCKFYIYCVNCSIYPCKQHTYFSFPLFIFILKYLLLVVCSKI